MRAVLPQPRAGMYRTTRVLPGTKRLTYAILPNVWDQCLFNDHFIMEDILAHGGLENCCPKGRKPYNTRPWIAMPSEGRRFKPVGTLPVPDLSDPANIGVDFPVLSVLVPKGYSGVITDYVCEINAPSGSGFVEGSGDLTWRLSAGISPTQRRYLRDLGNIKTSQGSLTSPNPVPRGGLRVYSDNLLEFSVNFAAPAVGNINPNAIVICSITGWYYPR